MYVIQFCLYILKYLSAWKYINVEIFVLRRHEALIEVTWTLYWFFKFKQLKKIVSRNPFHSCKKLYRFNEANESWMSEHFLGHQLRQEEKLCLQSRLIQIFLLFVRVSCPGFQDRGPQNGCRLNNNIVTGRCCTTNGFLPVSCPR
jgi:hypothetical protein